MPNLQHPRQLLVAVALLGSLSVAASADEAAPSYPLALGSREERVGAVRIGNDASHLLLELSTDGPYTLGALQVCASATPFAWTPPGQCPYKESLPAGATRHLLSIPRADVGASCGTAVHLQVHAEMNGDGGRSLGGAYAGGFKGQVTFAVRCCGNNACEAASGENATSCPADCAWDAAGMPMMRGAELLSADDFRQMSLRDGFQVVTRGTLDSGVARGTANVAAARSLVDGIVAANPDLARLKPMEPRETPRLQRMGDGNYRMTLGRGVDSTSFVVHGTDWLYEETASSLTRTFARDNQLTQYLSLFDSLPEDRRGSLPAPAHLGRLSDLDLARHNRELARRIEQFVPNRAFQVPQASSSAGVMSHGDEPQPGTGCSNHRAGNLYMKYDWPLKSYTTPIRSQGSRGTCVSFAVVAGLEARIWRTKGLATDYSEQELYASAKGLWFPTSDAFGDGLNIGNVFDEMVDRTYRVDAEPRWRYNPSWDRVEDEDEETYSASCVDYEGYCSNTNHQMKRVCSEGSPAECAMVQPPGVTGTGHHPARVTGTTSLWNLLEPESSLSSIRAQLNLGRPVVMGVEVDEWFQDAAAKGMDDAESAGVVSTGNNGADEAGGHAVLVVGYLSNGQIPEDSNVQPGLGGGYFIVKNSWGCAGDGGYMYLSYAWMSDQAVSAYALTGVATSAVLPEATLAIDKAVVTTPGKVRVTATFNAATTRVVVFQGLDKETPIFVKTVPGGSDSTRFVDVHFGGPEKNGLYFFWATVKDQFGNVTGSNIVGVNVNIDTVKPQVQLAAASGTVFAPGVVTLQASASDNVAIARVEFLRGLELLGQDVTAPFTLDQPVSQGDAGVSPFVALAYDTSGNVKVSNVIQVTVVPVSTPLVQAFNTSTSGLSSSGGTVTLTWNVAGATSVNIAPLLGTVPPRGTATVNVSRTTSFVLSARNPEGTRAASAVVAVASVAPPVVRSFTATPARLPAGGGRITLAFDVIGSETTLSIPGVGDVTGATSRDVAVTETTTFVLLASNPGGIVRRAVTVEVATAPR